MNGWNLTVIGLCSPVLVFLLWKEWQRTDRSWLPARIMATAVAVASLAGIGMGLKDRRMGAAPKAPRAGATVASGFVAADWQRRLVTGQRLAVQGRWSGPRVRLVLTGMGGVLDSAQVQGGEFELHTVPAQTGRAVYRLAALQGKDTLEQEDIPVEVEAAKTLKILVLAATPGFEDRFLINWLGAGGHAVAARIAVSKEKYQQTFVNMESRRLDVLDAALLSGFDLVIADVGTAGDAVLHREVAAGLGLLIRVDSAGQTVPGWNVGGRVIIRDSLGQVAVRSGMVGTGRVAISAANSTYVQWMEGRRQAYADYWTSLLQEVTRRRMEGEEWRFHPALPRVGEPVVARLATDAALPQGMIGDAMGTSSAVYLAEDAWMPWLWKGQYWPEKGGWQLAHTPGGDTAWWYAWPADAWKANPPIRTGQPGFERLREDNVEITKIWIYAVLLSSMTFLWVERKISGMKG
jgi:hypothetical protein